MEQSTIAIIVVIATAILYITEKFSVTVTTMIGMLAMIFTGCLDYQVAFTQFTNSTILLVFGMAIIINALFESGVASRLGTAIFKLVGHREKLFVMVVIVFAGVLSGFMQNASLVAMMLPIIASLAASSGGKITKKNTYLPLAIGSLLGGCGTLIGSTPPMLANAAMVSAGYEEFSFFETGLIGYTVLLVIALCYWLFLYKLQCKWLNFEEVKESSQGNATEIPLDKKKATISIIVFLICVVLFIIRPFGWDVGLISVTGGFLLILIKCVDGQKALRDMFWSTLITVGAALGLAKGFVDSGAGEVIVKAIIKVLGDWTTMPIVLVTVFLLLGWLLSQFMSNGSLVAMLAAIAVSMATEIGCDPKPLVMACLFGASMAFATPTATTSVTMVQVAGYRFKDYLKVGGTIGLIGVTVSWIMIILVYGLI